MTTANEKGRASGQTGAAEHDKHIKQMALYQTALGAWGPDWALHPELVRDSFCCYTKPVRHGGSSYTPGIWFFWSAAGEIGRWRISDPIRVVEVVADLERAFFGLRLEAVGHRGPAAWTVPVELTDGRYSADLWADCLQHGVGVSWWTRDFLGVYLRSANPGVLRVRSLDGVELKTGGE